MDSYIDIENLRENSNKYQSLIGDQKFTSNVLRFFEVVKNELTDTLQSLIITNRDKLPQPSSEYTLKICRESVELLEINSTTRNNILLTFDPPNLSLNNKQMGGAYSRAFGMRIREIISDLKRDLCFVFEEHI
jgi:hypothetical protein